MVVAVPSSAILTTRRLPFFVAASSCAEVQRRDFSSVPQIQPLPLVTVLLERRKARSFFVVSSVTEYLPGAR